MASELMEQVFAADENLKSYVRIKHLGNLDDNITSVCVCIFIYDADTSFTYYDWAQKFR